MIHKPAVTVLYATITLSETPISAQNSMFLSRYQRNIINEHRPIDTASSLGRTVPGQAQNGCILTRRNGKRPVLSIRYWTRSRNHIISDLDVRTRRVAERYHHIAVAPTRGVKPGDVVWQVVEGQGVRSTGGRGEEGLADLWDGGASFRVEDTVGMGC